MIIVLKAARVGMSIHTDALRNAGLLPCASDSLSYESSARMV